MGPGDAPYKPPILGGGGGAASPPPSPGRRAQKWNVPEEDVPINPPGTNPHNLPDFLSSIPLKYVKLGYHLFISHAWKVVLLPVAAGTALELTTLQWSDLLDLWHQAQSTHVEISVVLLGLCFSLLLATILTWFFSRANPVYLVDFECFKPPEECRVTKKKLIDMQVSVGRFTQESIDFQEKILARSGLGDHTYLPSNLLSIPPDISMARAREEAEMVMFTVLEGLFRKTGVNPKDIGVLIVNCSLFNPTPSLSAMIVNHFKMRSGVQTYNLSGMGCSAGVISVHLAKELLQVHSGTLAVVVSTENITQNWYFGNDRSKLIPNTLFRLGGAAVLLSNRRRHWWTAKYELSETVRTHRGADDESYGCIFQEEDAERQVGVRLSKEVMAIAGQSLKVNITTLGPMVLPASEQVLFFANLIARKFLGFKLRPYIPDFKLAFEHFCIHTGGRGVIDEIEKNLDLAPENVEPSRKTLERFGNTSSSSIWYELAYSESMGRVKRGDRVWQIAFGSGFKCNSGTWRALRTITDVHEAWADSLKYR